MSIITRLFNNSDFEKLNQLCKLYDDLGYPTNENDLKKRLKKITNHDDYFLLLLIKENKIIGLSGMCKMMFYEKNAEYMRVLAFVIHSEFRKKGYGKRLLADSEEFSKRLNCKAITLNSGNRNERLSAHKLYSDNGYVSNTSGFTKQL
ncbi:GNAT family N-acetyltransferase [Staphylococcus aureus]|uniref:GNAT family N-acetyltransferase n=1 Tax=Staphylococcus aureus TaxID=1280 RepID=UPI001C1E8DF6|nr:GNAT family N-acetyltransferase [Staphylococcus aureus]MBU6963798.1 GNAT family N-acetyltransferase [Staphylococcus aureus]MCA0161329.1 GNAT family N-acetyltransferase [Staphylococcus aureus]